MVSSRVGIPEFPTKLSASQDSLSDCKWHRLLGITSEFREFEINNRNNWFIFKISAFKSFSKSFRLRDVHSLQLLWFEVLTTFQVSIVGNIQWNKHGGPSSDTTFRRNEANLRSTWPASLRGLNDLSLSRVLIRDAYDKLAVFLGPDQSTYPVCRTAISEDR